MNLQFNLLAKNVANAKEIMEATDGRALIGIMVKHFPSIEEAAETIQTFQDEDIPVSVGLGAGDPTQWEKVVQVSVQTKPAHVNQVFPAAGYTLASLQSANSEHTIVNALIAPSGTPGKVFICTGPASRLYREPVSCDLAAAMLAETGVQSVKFYPIEGKRRLDEVAEMVKAAVRHQIRIFEPTGGIDLDSLPDLVKVCAQHGSERIIPHIYTSIVDRETGRTRVEDVKALFQSVF
ncbi:KDGP aldolase [Kroppenstedtia eburnea]|uniref:2-dehydro-3-deoxy-phosphogluconate aldolase n=1 Tax=Kroppenstedtia eburnea TaxID=714067 RepID=A0A1N7KQU7_9BACL|nr:KDGP aldolase [Kroppenstedtia eburnea]QKI82855.1 oxo-acid lyase [Kroppenstedtia eburnea]SIS63921.1 2-dehydro-3-deoxy-phosphogluconate aldolase [Kroppenstedtia eburnea]